MEHVTNDIGMLLPDKCDCEVQCDLLLPQESSIYGDTSYDDLSSDSDDESEDLSDSDAMDDSYKETTLNSSDDEDTMYVLSCETC